MARRAAAPASGRECEGHAPSDRRGLLAPVVRRAVRRIQRPAEALRFRQNGTLGAAELHRDDLGGRVLLGQLLEFLLIGGTSRLAALLVRHGSAPNRSSVRTSLVPASFRCRRANGAHAAAVRSRTGRSPGSCDDGQGVASRPGPPANIVSPEGWISGRSPRSRWPLGLSSGRPDRPAGSRRRCQHACAAPDRPGRATRAGRAGPTDRCCRCRRRPRHRGRPPHRRPRLESPPRWSAGWSLLPWWRC